MTAPAFEAKREGASTRVPTRQFLSFLLAGEEYAVDILRVREIRGWEGATPIPNTPPHVKGMINLRGAIVPIVGLRERFGLEAAEYGPTTVVVVLQVMGSDKARTMGVVVDAVSDVHDVPEDNIRPPPELGASAPTDFIAGLATTQDRMIILLNIDRLLGSAIRTDAEATEEAGSH